MLLIYKLFEIIFVDCYILDYLFYNDRNLGTYNGLYLKIESVE